MAKTSLSKVINTISTGVHTALIELTTLFRTPKRRADDVLAYESWQDVGDQRRRRLRSHLVARYAALQQLEQYVPHGAPNRSFPRRPKTGRLA